VTAGSSIVSSSVTVSSTAVSSTTGSSAAVSSTTASSAAASSITDSSTVSSTVSVVLASLIRSISSAFLPLSDNPSVLHSSFNSLTVQSSKGPSSSASSVSSTPESASELTPESASVSFATSSFFSTTGS